MIAQEMAVYVRRKDPETQLKAELTIREDTKEWGNLAGLPVSQQPGGSSGEEKAAQPGDLYATLHVEGIRLEMEEALVRIDYEGFSAELTQLPGGSGKILRKDGRAADHFYTGQPWEIGVKRFAGPDGCADFCVTIHPLREGEAVYLQNWTEMSEGKACRIKDVQAVEIRRIPLRF